MQFKKLIAGVAAVAAALGGMAWGLSSGRANIDSMAILDRRFDLLVSKQAPCRAGQGAEH